MATENLRATVEQLLAEVQPMLGLHGGSIELVSITEDGIVALRFKGACVGCSAADITLEYGLKELLMLKCEEITDVVAVNDEAITHDAPTIPLPYAQRS